MLIPSAVECGPVNTGGREYLGGCHLHLLQTFGLPSLHTWHWLITNRRCHHWASPSSSLIIIIITAFCSSFSTPMLPAGASSASSLHLWCRPSMCKQLWLLTHNWMSAPLSHLPVSQDHWAVDYVCRRLFGDRGGLFWVTRLCARYGCCCCCCWSEVEALRPQKPWVY